MLFFLPLRVFSFLSPNPSPHSHLHTLTVSPLTFTTLTLPSRSPVCTPLSLSLSCNSLALSLPLLLRFDTICVNLVAILLGLHFWKFYLDFFLFDWYLKSFLNLWRFVANVLRNLGWDLLLIIWVAILEISLAFLRFGWDLESFSNLWWFGLWFAID